LFDYYQRMQIYLSQFKIEARRRCGYNLAVVALVAWLCCFASLHASAEGGVKLRVGVISGLTGAAAKWCDFQNKGMVLAQEELSREGLSIELIFEDSQTQAPKVISAYNKLRQLDKVDAIIADDFGLVIAPLLSLIERQATPLVALSLPQDVYCKRAPSRFFSVSSKIPNSRAAYDRFFELHPNVKRIGLVVFDDPEWGNAYLSIWREIAIKRGIEIVDTFLNNEWQPDFKTALTRMFAKSPDAILFAHEPTGMLKAARQLGFDKPLVAANNVLEILAGADSHRTDLDGVYVVDLPISSEFSKSFVERFKRNPILEAYAGYESVRVIARAAALNPKDLALGIRQIKYAGIAGEIDFTQNNCAGNDAHWELFKFVNGEQIRQ